jgi:hypothetical protein
VKILIFSILSTSAFFEKLAIEAKLDDNKPILMQTTLTARKTFVARAKSKRYQERRKRVQSLSKYCAHSVYFKMAFDGREVNKFIVYEIYGG